MKCPHCGKTIPDPIAEHARSIGKLGGRPRLEFDVDGDIYTRCSPVSHQMRKGIRYYLCKSGTKKLWLDRDGRIIPF